MTSIETTVATLLTSNGNDAGDLVREAIEAGLEPPVFVIGPTSLDLVVGQHLALLSWWEALPRDTGLPDSGHLTPQALRDYLGRLVIVEPINDGADFRYRLYGSTTAAYIGADLTGKTVSDSYKSGAWPVAVSRYHLAAFQAAYRGRQAVLTMQAWSSRLTPYRWHRLILPFDGSDGRVNRLMLLTVPCTFEGEPLSPWQFKHR